MKLCDECGVNPANIHLTQIMQNETHVSHLCEQCAEKKGISVAISEDMLTAQDEPIQEKSGKTCSSCGLNYSIFKTKGWLGCSECYHSFETEIDDLLIQMHGSLVHKGKQYKSNTGSPKALTGEMKRLRHELAVAIKNEEFEQAASLRDAIYSIKQMGTK